MLFVILQKDLRTEAVSVHSIYDSEQHALAQIERLISEGIYGYKMETVS
jgi:hypothetical protein